MSSPDENVGGEPKENKESKEAKENLFKIVDDIVAHTNRSRRLFMIFIASALIFGPVALGLGGVLLGHPTYNIRHLEAGNEENSTNMPQSGMHLQLVSANGTVIQEMPVQQMPPMHSPRAGFIFLELNIFIIISIVFGGILLFIAIKEYRFFAKWNKRFAKFKSMQDKIDKELED
ncbi:MAG TPA: hypothetical protein VEJ68_00030 [Candidatus Bathyarchaeia archaeon]|nr:hypothetical protein [Candidatus Bathyarchaeia archaeon]